VLGAQSASLEHASSLDTGAVKPHPNVGPEVAGTFGFGPEVAGTFWIWSFLGSSKVVGTFLIGSSTVVCIFWTWSFFDSSKVVGTFESGSDDAPQLATASTSVNGKERIDRAAE